MIQEFSINFALKGLQFMGYILFFEHFVCDKKVQYTAPHTEVQID